MNFKSMVSAATIALLCFSTHAITTPPVQVVGPSFSDVELGTFTVNDQSDVIGSLGFAPYVLVFPGVQIALPAVTFYGVSAYNPIQNFSTDATLSGSNFDLSDLSPGTYTLRTSGALTGSNFIAAQFNVFSVSAVPEPADYAMVLAGLFALAVVRRRSEAPSNS